MATMFYLLGLKCMGKEHFNINFNKMRNCSLQETNCVSSTPRRRAKRTPPVACSRSRSRARRTSSAQPPSPSTPRSGARRRSTPRARSSPASGATATLATSSASLSAAGRRRHRRSGLRDRRRLGRRRDKGWCRAGQGTLSVG